MLPRWKWRAFRLAERPGEVSLVTAACLAELVAAARDERDERVERKANGNGHAGEGGIGGQESGVGRSGKAGNIGNVARESQESSLGQSGSAGRVDEAGKRANLSKAALPGAGAPVRLPRDEALRLFDGACRESTLALRAFLRDNGLGPSVGLVRAAHLLSYVRQEIAVGALVAIRPAAEQTRITVLPRRAAPAQAPIPLRRAPGPALAAAPEDAEGPEFMCPGPQAQALIAAAASGAPFCAECARAAAARAAMMSS